MAFYCLGLGVPFLLVALGFGWVSGALGFVRRHRLAVSRIGGGLLVAMGLLLVTGAWDHFVNWLHDEFGVDQRGRACDRRLRLVRRAWRRLISMRTALVLLFLLAIAAVPGLAAAAAPAEPDQDRAYIAIARRLGPVPRPHRHVRRVRLDLVRRDLPAAVRLAGRLPDPADPPARQGDAAPSRCRRRRTCPGCPSRASSPCRVRARAVRQRPPGRRWAGGGASCAATSPAASITLSAEKGYSRETGNLVFHLALLAALILIAVGRLYMYSGQRVVLQGADQGFCNTVSQYDSWSPGRFAADGRITPAPFCINEMNKFTATYNSVGRADPVRGRHHLSAHRSTRRCSTRRSRSTTRCASRATGST